MCAYNLVTIWACHHKLTSNCVSVVIHKRGTNDVPICGHTQTWYKRCTNLLSPPCATLAVHLVCEANACKGLCVCYTVGRYWLGLCVRLCWKEVQRSPVLIMDTGRQHPGVGKQHRFERQAKITCMLSVGKQSSFELDHAYAIDVIPLSIKTGKDCGRDSWLQIRISLMMLSISLSTGTDCDSTTFRP